MSGQLQCHSGPLDGAEVPDVPGDSHTLYAKVDRYSADEDLVFKYNRPSFSGVPVEYRRDGNRLVYGAEYAMRTNGQPDNQRPDV